MTSLNPHAVEPIMAGATDYGQSPVPWEMVSEQASHLPPLLRKYPEVLFALIGGLEPDVRAALAEPLGLPGGGSWTLFHAVAHELPADHATRLLLEIEEAYRSPIREDQASSGEGKNARAVGARVFGQLFEQHLEAYRRGEQSLVTLLRTVAVLYLHPSPERTRVIGQIRADFRSVLEAHYPEMFRIPVPGRPEPLTLLDLPRWIEEQMLERSALERRVRRAERKVEALEETLRSERRKAAPQPRADRAPAASGPDPRTAESTDQDTRRYLALRGHHAPPGALHQAEAERLRSALAHERNLRAQERAELIDLLGEEVGADLDGRSPNRSIAGQQVLLIGGVDETLPALQAAVAAEQATLVHYDGDAADVPVSMIRSSHVVVFKTRQLNHNTYQVVKNACHAHGVPFRHWRQRAPETLIRTLLFDPWDQARAEIEAEARRRDLTAN